MLPSCRQFMAFIGAEELVKNHGFVTKPGHALKLRQEKREGYSDFIELDPDNITWNVIRSQFDERLLRHASASGVKVFEGLNVTDIKFSGERPASAIYETQSTQANETGWAWYIPLHDGTTSVGVVISKDSYAEKKALANNGLDDPMTRLYMAQLAQAPELLQLLGKARLASGIKSAGDYSYSASRYAGAGYRIAGDAGAFIDPLFSTGVHLAMIGGLSAASTIAASIRGDCSEEKATEFHNSKVGVSYTRFLIVVLSVYRQIQAQKEDILSDVDEDNFDRAFRLLRPVIQGAADIDPKLTPQE
ncbi:hypothetical protein E4T56_gene1652, partial [Termitomyces sp. T112]